MLIYQLRMCVAAEQHAEIIKPSYNALQLDTIYQKDRDRCLVFPNVVQEHVLNVLRLFRVHGYSPIHFLELSGPAHARHRNFSKFRAELPIGRWSRLGESQALEKAKQRGA